MLLRLFVPVRIVASKPTLEHRFRCARRLRVLRTCRRFTHDLPKKNEEFSSALPVEILNGTHFSNENSYFHGVMERMERYQGSIFTKQSIITELCDPGNLDIEAMNSQDWNAMTDLELVETFRKVISYALSRMTISENCLKPVCNAVEGRLGTLSVENLIVVGKLFVLWSENNRTENSRIFAEALDAVCQDIIRNHRYNFCSALQLAELWYWYGIREGTKFLQSIVFNLLPEAKEPQHILQLLFYLNVMRHLSKSYIVYSFEKILLSVEPVSSLDELAFAALGFHKSNNTIQNSDLKRALIKRLKKDAYTVHEMTLNAVCKTVCHGVPPETKQDIFEVQGIIMQRAQELSFISLKSLLRLGSMAVAVHTDFVLVVFERVLNNLETIRMKDVCLFMEVFTSYTFDGVDVKMLAERVNEVIREPEKMKLLQSNKFYHTVLIHHLMFAGVWPLDLIANLLSSVTNDNVKEFPRSILSIDIFMEVFYPDLKEVRLSTENRRVVFQRLFANRISLQPDSFHSIEITKWTEFLKSAVTNGDDLFVATHIIPTNYPDLVLCVDKFGLPVSIPDQLLEYEPWEVKKIPKCFQSTEKKLIAIIFVGKDSRKKSVARNHREKMMILEQLGYHVYVIQLPVWVSEDKRVWMKSFTEFIQSITTPC